MSSASAQPKTLGTRVTEFGALAAIGGLMWAANWVTGPARGDLVVVAAVGFLLLAGLLTADVLEIARLPHLTGYILAGVVAGPHVLHLVTEEAVKRLESVNSLALSLIALAGGGELRIDAVRAGMKRLFWSTVVQHSTVLVLTAATFVALTPWIPFTHGRPWPALVAIAMLWGLMASSRSPSATLAILSQTRAKGPVAQFALVFVMVSDVVVVVLLAFVFSYARGLLSGGDIGFSVTDLKVLGQHIIGSIALGTTLGLILSAYLKLVGGNVLLVLIAFGFVVSQGIDYVGFDPLLTFLVAGFIVQNHSEQGEKLLHAVKQTGSVVFIVFFATTGAHLNLPLLAHLWPLALLLSGARALFTLVAHVVSTRIAADPPVLRRWGWAPLMSQAGLTLGIAAIVARGFTEFGSAFQSLAVATVAVNEIMGPILFKLALDRTGETRSLASRDSMASDPATGGAPF